VPRSAVARAGTSHAQPWDTGGVSIRRCAGKLNPKGCSFALGVLEGGVGGQGRAGVVGSGVSGSGVSGSGSMPGLRESDILFITISHCAWRHVISLSKATKKRSKESAFKQATLSVHSVRFLFIGAPKARCSPERRMCETLLLANPDMNTLRPVRSRASTSCQGASTASRVFPVSFFGALVTWSEQLFPPAMASRVLVLPYWYFISWRVNCVDHALIFADYGLTHFRDLVSSRVGDVVRGACKFGGRSSADSAG
jgi:hypothetical protein